MQESQNPVQGGAYFSLIMQLERALRSAQSEAVAEYRLINDLRRLVPFDSAALWREGDWRGGRLAALSGADYVDQGSEAARRWKSLAAYCLAGQFACGVVEHAAVEGLQAVEGQLLWCPLNCQSVSLGGVLLLRKEPWRKEETDLIRLLSESMAHALWAWRRNVPFWISIAARWRAAGKRKRISFLALLAGAMLFPVRQSALAPAEITPESPVVISAPMDGVVSAVHVMPNSAVKEGQVLLSLDDAALRSRHAVAGKALAIAQADLQRVTAKAFSDDQSKGELSVLQARVEERMAELSYLQEQLERTAVKAPNDGIAIYGDPNEWLGKPVSTGEKIMLLADPERVEIRAYLPVDDAIALDVGAPVSMFLNVAPLTSVDGIMASASYEAYPSNNGVLSYIIKAKIRGNGDAIRVGLQGTAKIYGGRVALIYYLFRRPFSNFRRLTGI